MNWTEIIIALIPAVFSYLGIVRQMKKGNTKIETGQQCLLRSNILEIYYQNKAGKKLTQYQRENLDDLFQAYKALDGNSFIDDIYEKMRNWDVIQ